MSVFSDPKNPARTASAIHDGLVAQLDVQDDRDWEGVLYRLFLGRKLSESKEEIGPGDAWLGLKTLTQ